MTIPLHFDSKGLNGDLSEIYDAITSTDDDWIQFTPASITPDKEDESPVDATSHAVSITFPKLSRLGNNWLSLPHRLASLIAAPETEAIVAISRSAFDASDGLRDVPFPVWDWIIRTLKAGGTCHITNHLECEIPEVTRPSLAPSEPGAEQQWLVLHLDQFEPEELNVAGPDAVSLKAGLLQIHDYLEESHSCSQSVQHQGRHKASDYWHGIMHRREPDYSNAKYWFRNVGSHPIFADVAIAAAELKPNDTPGWDHKLKLSSGWDPFAFIDLCQECNRSGNLQLVEWAENIQWAEMLLLLEQTWDDAG